MKTEAVHMPRGRPPKPDNVHVLQGTRSRAIKHDLEHCDAGDLLEKVPEPPHALQSDIARNKWHEAASALIDARVLKASDLDTLESYCFSYQMMCQAADIIEIDGMIVEGGMGGPVKNPACLIMKDSQAELRQLSNLLGLNPSARAKVAVGGKRDPKGGGRSLRSLAKPIRP